MHNLPCDSICYTEIGVLKFTFSFLTYFGSHLLKFGVPPKAYLIGIIAINKI